MNNRDKAITKSLLLIAYDLEQQFRAMEKLGVEMLFLEQSQMKLLHSILKLNSVKDSDPQDIIATPVFKYLADEMELHTCINELGKQLYIMRQGRRGEAIESNL